MNNYNARLLANIVKWIRDNRKDVPFAYDGVNYTLTLRMESIFIERDNEINQGVYLEDRKFNWSDGLLEVIWKEIEKIRLNEIATKLEKMVESSEQKNKELKETLKKGYLDAIHEMLKTENKVRIVTIDNEIYRIFLYSGYVACSDKEYTTCLSDKGSDFIEKVYQFLNPSTENKSTDVDNQDEVKMDYRKLLLNDLSQHMEDFNVLLDNKEFLTKDTEEHLTWALRYIQETFNGITDNRIIPKSQMQKVKEYLQDKEYVITEVEIIKYISSKLSTFKANEYPHLANVIELTLGTGYYDSSDLTQTFVKVKEFFEKDRYKELYEILKG